MRFSIIKQVLTKRLYYRPFLPARQQQNGFLNRISPETLTYGLIGLNGLVFLEWQRSKYRLQQGDVLPFVKMNENFTCSPNGLFLHHRLHTIITCLFSHSSTSHFLMNMLGLYSFAPTIISIFGAKYFMKLYFGSGIVSALTSVVHQYYQQKTQQRKTIGTMGASGGLMGLAGCFALHFPQVKFNLFFVLPIPALWCVGGLALFDFLMISNNSRIDHIGHLGGLGFGFLYYYLTKRRF